MKKPSISVIFITKNEEYHISAAIENVRDIAEEVFVVDSGSTDGTVDLAEKAGAKVLHHAFEGFGAQWNWALENCPIKTDWTMKMDPDERLSEELKDEIAETIASPGATVGFSFDRVLWFMGRRLSGVRNEVLRIWRTGKCRFTDVSVNEYPLIDGEKKKLAGTMDHFDSSDLGHWLDKQNLYTTKEAEIRFKGLGLAARPDFFGNPLERRMALKKLFYALPGRYFLWFCYCYFGLGAWRSGRAGWHWARMRVFVMKLVELKWLEMKWRAMAER